MEFIPDNAKRIEEGLWELYTYYLYEIHNFEKLGFKFSKNFLTHYCELNINNRLKAFCPRTNEVICPACGESLPEDLLSIITLLGWFNGSTYK